MQIAIIGTGNTATVLGRLLNKKGHTIAGVYGRNKEKAYQLATELNAGSFGSIEECNSALADLFIIAVKDSAIAGTASLLHLQNKLVVHTAGAMPASTIKNASSRYGVLYPLQSLRKELTRIPGIPFCIDGCDNEVLEKIQALANSISTEVYVTNDATRLKLHTAAVITSNFSNFLYTLAEDFCQKENIPFSALLPLAGEIVHRLGDESPSLLQTGPAIRKDENTLQQHLAILQAYPMQQEVYKFLSAQIAAYYHK